MTAPETDMHCPNDETLAAFIDGTLDATSRREVLDHAADCAICREVIVMGTEIAEAEAPAATVVRPAFGRRFLPIVAAVAAAIVVAFAIPSVRERILGEGGMSELVAAARSMKERPTEARLSGDFDYRKAAIVTRGSVEGDANYNVLGALAQAQDRAEKDPSPEHLHELGVANFLAGHRGDAVVMLEQSATAAPNDAAILSDLAAAYLARGDEGDAERALHTAGRAASLHPSPSAEWNRALALQALHRDPDALTAWKKIADAEGSSPWGVEAREKIADLAP